MKRRVMILCGWLCLIAFARNAGAAPQDEFGITVIDDVTGRGVPLVALRTVNEEVFYTDSAGMAALDEPELMGRTVWFGLSSHGYEYPADGFGYRGVALKVVRGGRVTVKIHRVNIAERLYRLTGAGIYRDSVLLGLPAPIKQPLMDGLVMGQDTVEVTPYAGRLFWFFGDTQRPSYPLGQFATSGASSLLPGRGGLDPERGVDLTYWTDGDGFSRPMLPLPSLSGSGGPVWVGGLFTLPDPTGHERLLVRYTHLDGQGRPAETGLARWNDARSGFEKLRAFDLQAPLMPEGHPFRAVEGGQSYLYFQPTTGVAMPLVRVRADWPHATDPKAYEAFTCLAPGERRHGADTRLDRDKDGRLVYGWKADTATLGYDDQQALIAAGRMTPGEAALSLRDIETDAPVLSHGGSVFWNAFRKRWVMITGQQGGGPSFLGELWFAEADTPVGPWVYVRRIVTHDRYTFYNPTQHPFFDADGGRRIFFEGTYTDTYSSNPDKTPRYNYNQIMYGLSLDDPRLALPAPVYRLARPDGTAEFAAREAVDDRDAWGRVRSVPFFAVPPAGSHAGLVPVTASDGSVLFYGLPAAIGAAEKPSPAVAPLYAYQPAAGGAVWFSLDAADKTPNAVRSPQPVCRVWRSPNTVLALDAGAHPDITRP